MKLKYKSETGHRLEIAKGGDVGMDLRTIKEFDILPFQTRKVKTGISLELPRGYEAQIRPKSSISAKGILVHLGTIDNGYRGDLTVVMTNLNNVPIHFDEFQKIAQVVIKKYKDNIQTIQLEEINTDTERGITNFGSSGKF